LQGPSGEGQYRRRDQYGQHGQGEYGQGSYGQRQQGQDPYAQRRGYGAGRTADYGYRSRDYGSSPPTRSEAYEQRPRGYGSRGYSSFSQAPFAQQPFGHAPFGHAAFGESDEPHYFGTGSQGYGGGPSFTGGTYGYADERSDSPYFPEVGFNRDYYEDPLARESYPQDRYPRESYPRHQPYPYPRAAGMPGAPPQRRRYPLGPKGYKRSDERLREDISERLMQAYDIDSSDVTIQVLGAKVVLEGTVPDRYMKHAIENLADAAPGVEDVENRIRVVAFGETGQSRGSRDTGQPFGTQSAGADAGSPGGSQGNASTESSGNATTPSK
jgi:BON domain